MYERELPAPPGNADNAANVEGRRPAPPEAGFGQLWLKELTLTLPDGPAPEAVMAYWKAHIDEMWPDAGGLHRGRAPLLAGDLLGIDLSLGPATLATGVVVIASDATSLTLLSPEGHMLAGTNRLETRATPEGTVACVTLRFRASDPLYEAGLMLGGHESEERFWADMLWRLGDRFEAGSGTVHLMRQRLDRRRHWGRIGNVRQNAFIHTSLRRLARRLTGRPR